MTNTSSDTRVVQLVELDSVGSTEWQQLIAGEREPFGAIGAGLSWSEKPLNVGILDDEGTLVAAGGLGPARVRVAESPAFLVAGLGGVIVTQRARGRGLGRMLVAALLARAPTLETDRVMLFCLPRLAPFYSSFGFQTIRAPVFAQQPQGRIEMPMGAMWKALHGQPDWPEGEVEVLGEPF